MTKLQLEILKRRDDLLEQGVKPKFVLLGRNQWYALRQGMSEYTAQVRNEIYTIPIVRVLDDDFIEVV